MENTDVMERTLAREKEQFDRFCSKRMLTSDPLHWLSICTPNYTHDAFIRYGLRLGVDVICEKPLVLNPYNIDNLENLEKETGIGTGDIQRRMMDFGMHYWTSHHPYYLPEPMTLEPTETPSKKDIDEYIETLKYVFREARENPEIIRTAPHRSVTHQVDESSMDDPEKWALTWKVYCRKYQ